MHCSTVCGVSGKLGLQKRLSFHFHVYMDALQHSVRSVREAWTTEKTLFPFSCVHGCIAAQCAECQGSLDYRKDSLSIFMCTWMHCSTVCGVSGKLGLQKRLSFHFHVYMDALQHSVRSVREAWTTEKPLFP